MSNDERKKLLNNVPGTRYQLLLGGSDALDALEDWLSGSWRADVRIRRAKTAKKVVLETTDAVFASRVVLRFSGVRVNIASPVVEAAAQPPLTEKPLGVVGCDRATDGTQYRR